MVDSWWMNGSEEHINLDCEEPLGLGVGLPQVTQHPWLIDTHSEISNVFIGQTARNVGRSEVSIISEKQPPTTYIRNSVC